MPFSSAAYLDIFNKDIDESKEEQIENIRQRNKNVCTYGVKTIKSGPMLECEIYPVWLYREEASLAKKEKEREAQMNLNDKNARKKFIRLINTNFNENDLAIDLTYRGYAPNEKEARKDVQNFIRRLKNYYKKHKLPELKYVYVIEFDNTEGSKKRIHFHLLISGDIDREIVEKLWHKGYANSRRLQPNEYGLEGIARYLTKDPKGCKRWGASKNLKKPRIFVAYNKIKKRRVEKIAKNIEEARRIFEKIFEGYTFNDISVKYNDYVSGAYIYVRMRKSNVNNKQKIYGVKEW